MEYHAWFGNSTKQDRKAIWRVVQSTECSSVSSSLTCRQLKTNSWCQGNGFIPWRQTQRKWGGSSFKPFRPLTETPSPCLPVLTHRKTCYSTSAVSEQETCYSTGSLHSIVTLFTQNTLQHMDTLHFVTITLLSLFMSYLRRQKHILLRFLFYT